MLKGSCSQKRRPSFNQPRRTTNVTGVELIAGLISLAIHLFLVGGIVYAIIKINGVERKFRVVPD